VLIRFVAELKPVGEFAASGITELLVLGAMLPH
jgi:hypothetical protein